MPPVDPPESAREAALTDADLEAAVTELAAHIHAATYRLVRLIAEIDRRELWADWGIRSCAHWLSWKCGLDLGAAREKVRVARALGALPAIAAAFAGGEISYSKVRAMTRVATPENEDYLLYIARAGTASHVESLVRKYRRVKAVEEAAAANARHEARELTWAWEEDGSLTIRAKLPPEEGARVIAALDAAMDELAHESRPREAGEDIGDVSAETPPEAGAPSPRVSAETPAAGATEAPPKGARLRVARDRSPTSGDFCARPMVARRADALLHIADRALAARGAGTRPADRYQLVVHVDVEALAGRDPDARCDLEDGPRIATETTRRIGCDAGIVGLLDGAHGEPLSVGRRTRAIPPSIRRALHARDGGCRFPGCTATRHVEGHHVKHWAAGGETSLGNLVELCSSHHRLVHEGGYRVRPSGEGTFEFARPDGRPIEPTPRWAESAGHWEQRHLERANRTLGLDIGPDTCVPGWEGERMDYGMAIDALLFDDGLLGRARAGRPGPPRLDG